eukprot:tig00020537_g10230.t1
MRVFVNNADCYVGGAIGKALSEAKHEVVGTLQGKRKPAWLAQEYPNMPGEELKMGLLSAQVIIYDLENNQTDHATFAIQELQSASYDQEKTFICLSSVMCWARTPPKEKEDNDGLLTEDDFKNRRPHPLYRNHVQVEKLVVKAKKANKLKTYVVCAGIPYGGGEETFHQMFKLAWLCNPRALPCVGDGDNVVPTIYVHDLAAVVGKVIAAPPEEQQYIVAVDDSHHTLRQITMAVSKQLGTGEVRYLSKEEILAQVVETGRVDVLQIDVRIQSGVIQELEGLDWRCRGGLIESLPMIISEFRETRGLTPVKVMVEGPPAAGKSFYAERIAREYRIHHIRVADVIREAMAGSDELAKQLREKAGPDGRARLPEEKVIEAVKRKLLSAPCMNQGFVIDGYPKSFEHALLLFTDEKPKKKKKKPAEGEEAPEGDAPEEEEEPEPEPEPEPEEEGDGEEGAKRRKKKKKPEKANLCPDYVLALEAPEETLKQRVLALPQEAVEGSHNTEEGFTRRLREYRERSDAEKVNNTLLNFFEDRETIIVHADTSVTTDPEAILKMVADKVGPPHNYGPSEEEVNAKARKREAEEARKHEQARLELHERERLEAEDRARRLATEAARMAEVEAQEREILEVRSYPLRKYLMENVIPTLTKGLIQVCKVRPEDPVDYLAEYLFAQNSAEEDGPAPGEDAAVIQ